MNRHNPVPSLKAINIDLVAYLYETLSPVLVGLWLEFFLPRQILKARKKRAFSVNNLFINFYHSSLIQKISSLCIFTVSVRRAWVFSDWAFTIATFVHFTAMLKNRVFLTSLRIIQRVENCALKMVRSWRYLLHHPRTRLGSSSSKWGDEQCRTE